MKRAAECLGARTTRAASALFIAFSSLVATLFDVSAARAESACNDASLIAGKLPASAADVRGDVRRMTDAKLAIEGADWDSDAAVTLQTDSGFLTYDLGEVRELRGFHLQADANDSYQIHGSADGRADSYKLLGTFANASARGHGLRERVLRIAPTRARFVRIGQGSGDGAYSVAEFGVYCQVPTPFPPVLDRAGSGPTSAPEAHPGIAPPPAKSVKADRGARAGLSALGAAAGFLLLIAWVFALERLPKRKRAKVKRADENEQPLSRTDLILRGLFVASGAAALIYEIVWMHLLRLVIGASALSVALVLGSFMGGMFVGSLLFSRFVAKTHSPLRVYAWLEAGIAGFGLLMPLLLPLARDVYVGTFGYGPLGIGVRALVAVLLVLPPTALMGAALPCIARHCSSSQRGMTRLAGLYASNTLGAVLGSLLSAFYLLAEGDVWIATFVAVGLNVVIATVAFRVGRRASVPEASTPTAPDEAGVDSVRPARALRVVLFATAISGMTALGAQVVWTRLLTLLFGATVYAFAIILSVFLAGLGIGSALSTSWLKRGVNPIRALAYTQAGLVPALFIGGWLLAEVLPYASPGGSIPTRALHFLHVLRAAEVMLPATILWGTSFPLALAALGSGAEDAGKSSGFVYAANTLGAIIGALATGFLAIPALGTRWAEQCLLLAAAVSAATLFFARGRLDRQSEGQTGLAAWTLGLGAVLSLLLPGMPIAFLAHGRYIGWSDPRDVFLYVSEGAASTVAVHQAPDGYRHFHVAGRVEASNNPGDLRLERLLGHLSALALPKPKSVLVVGLGGGVTAGALTLHPEIERIVICEIEPRVAGAAAQFVRENYDVLNNPRVELVFDDARHFLATTRERFDVITSDPIHPWVRGNSVLFSQEYYAIVKSKLKPGGIATQWVPLYETSETAIQIQMRTFMDAFPAGTVWNSSQTKRGYDVVLLGSVEPLQIDLLDIQQRIDRSAAIQASLRDVRIGSAVDLLGTYAASGHDMSGWLTNVPVNRDMSLKLEYISGLALNENRADDIYGKLSAARTYPESLLLVPAAQELQLRRRILEAR